MLKDSLFYKRQGITIVGSSPELWEVFVDGEWVAYDYHGDTTPESREWHNNQPRELVVIADGVYPRRLNGKEQGTAKGVYYKKGNLLKGY